MEDGIYGLQFGGCLYGDGAHSTHAHGQSPPPLAADSGYDINQQQHLPHPYEGFPLLPVAAAAFGVPPGPSSPWMQTGDTSAVSDAASDMAVEVEEESVSVAGARAKIAAHPLYPKLLQAYIDCQKVHKYVLCKFVYDCTCMSRTSKCAHGLPKKKHQLSNTHKRTEIGNCNIVAEARTVGGFIGNRRMGFKAVISILQLSASTGLCSSIGLCSFTMFQTLIRIMSLR